MNEKTSWLLIGLGAGALVGAAITSLTSPWSGGETRSRLRRLVRRRPSDEDVEVTYEEDVPDEARRAVGH